jgi:hypothetical protein
MSYVHAFHSPNVPAPIVHAGGPVGVTVASPSFEPMVFEAVRRFHRFTGLDTVILHTATEPGFAAKLNLDQLVGPRRIVFYDADWWALRPLPLLNKALASRAFWGVHCPGTFNPLSFPHTDCERLGMDKEDYINTGFFVCDLGNFEHRQVFVKARELHAAAVQGRASVPVDWTDQAWINLALQRLAVFQAKFPFSYNYYKRAVDWGNVPYHPREIYGLHAAGIAVSEKLKHLRDMESIFGEPVGPITPEAQSHHFDRTFAR